MKFTFRKSLGGEEGVSAYLTFLVKFSYPKICVIIHPLRGSQGQGEACISIFGGVPFRYQIYYIS